MNAIWVRWLIWLAVVVAAAVATGLATGSALVGMACAAVILLALTIYDALRMRRLWRMLDSPLHIDIPTATGMWGELYYRLHRLAKHWHSRVRQVERQHERFIEAMQVSPNGVVMLDGEGRIEWCNAISAIHFGLDASRDLGQHVTHLVRRPEFVAYLNAERYDVALRMHGMGGSHQEVLEVQVFPYGDNHRLVLSQDVTEVERTDAMRRDFVANVSHELKTPLTVLSGFLETLRDLPLSVADRNRYLESMAQQSARMQNIIQDLLVLARLEGDARPPLNERVSMNMLAVQLREDALTLSAGRHKIEFQIDNGLDLMGAESEIHSAMGNLLINAIRYTPAGGSIEVTWCERDGRGVFCVADTGPGIPAEHIPRLTERFYRVDHSRSRDTGGTGLGLAIVKHVLQRHDAQLIVRSTVGEGSTFSAVFPNARIVRRVSAHA